VLTQGQIIRKMKDAQMLSTFIHACSIIVSMMEYKILIKYEEKTVLIS